MAGETDKGAAVRGANLLAAFKRFYSNVDPDTLEGIERIYTQDIEFRDPVHTLQGLLALKNYMRHLYATATDIHFDYLDEQLDENTAGITWCLYYSHRHLNGGRPVSVRGHTRIRFTDRVFYQEDFYDMGSLLYQHIPVLGGVIRAVNARLRS